MPRTKEWFGVFVAFSITSNLNERWYAVGSSTGQLTRKRDIYISWVFFRGDIIFDLTAAVRSMP